MLKAIIFDMGGVLIRTQSRAGRTKWTDRLDLDAGELEELIFRGESGSQAQLGQKSSQAHWHWVGEQLELSEAELSRLREDFFAGDVLDQDLLAYIQRLGQAGYQLGLLSNAASNTRQILTETYPVLPHFDSVVISAEVGLMKPDPEIYRLAADRLEIAPEEALFVDDFVENVEGARQVGMQAIHFTDPAAARRQLETLTGVI